MMFEDRSDAGRKLAEKLKSYKNKEAVVLAIPRGGLIVAREVSKLLNLPLSIIVVRKLGYPTQPEFGFGAISEGNTIYLNKDTISSYPIDNSSIDIIIKNEKKELKRRIDVYRNGKKLPILKNKSVILVDDGLATGASATASILAVKKEKPKEIIFAVPVSAKDTSEKIKKEVNNFVCLITDRNLFAIGNYYKNFDQVDDEAILKILRPKEEARTRI